MAMAALVIDIGYARLAQRQMQTATDAAALEGLRFRDTLPPMSLPLSHDPDEARRQREEARRLQASTVVSQLFDDNLLADDADPLNFGAGPIVNFTGGAGDPSLEASQFIAIPDPPVYKPALVSNFVNGQPDDIRGDMVARTFTQITPGMTPEQIREHHLERSDYSRNDFSTNGDGAFLVRLRRTGESIPPNVGTAGPSLPYLFGRGSLLNRQLIGNGIKVRATAIAGVSRALSVGKSISTPVPITGLAEFALRASFWETLTVDTQSSANLGPQVIYIDLMQPSELLPFVLGRTPVATSTPPTVGTYEGYVPIYESFTEGSISVDRVIGFGTATADVSNADVSNTVTGTVISITRKASQIASENVSATLAFAFNDPTITPSVIDSVFKSNRSLSDPLLAPVLVR